MVHLTLERPFGFTAVRVPGNEHCVVQDIAPGGNAQLSGKVIEGMLIVSANSTATRGMSSDELADHVGAAVGPVSLGLLAPMTLAQARNRWDQIELARNLEREPAQKCLRSEQESDFYAMADAWIIDMNTVVTGSAHQDELSARDLTTIVRKLHAAFAPLVGTIETQQAMIAAQAKQLFYFR